AICRCPMRLGARRALADFRGSAQKLNDPVRDLAGRGTDFDGQRVLVGSRFLERIDLALQQAGRHEMAFTSRQMFGDERPAAAKVDEPYFGAIADDDLAIGALERGASDDPRLLPGALAMDAGGYPRQPGLAIGIGQRNSGVHLGDVRLGMEPVALLEGPPEPRCEILRDRRLARPGHAHDHEDRWTAAMSARAVE